MRSKKMFYVLSLIVIMTMLLASCGKAATTGGEGTELEKAAKAEGCHTIGATTAKPSRHSQLNMVSRSMSSIRTQVPRMKFRQL